MVGIPGILVIVLAIAVRLLALAVVIYVLVQLRGLSRGLRTLQTELEELRRALERVGE